MAQDFFRHTVDHNVQDVLYESDIKASLSPVKTEKKKTSNIWNELRPGTAMKREVLPGVWVRGEELKRAMFSTKTLHHPILVPDNQRG